MSKIADTRQVHLDKQRLDKWLWHARVVKARADAVGLVEAGRVRLNGDRQKTAAHPVRIGDVLTISLDRRVRVIRVTGFAERRGDSLAAQALYNESSATPANAGSVDSGH